MAQEVLVLSLCEDIKSVKSRHDMRNTYLLCSPLYFRVEDGSSLVCLISEQPGTLSLGAVLPIKLLFWDAFFFPCSVQKCYDAVSADPVDAYGARSLDGNTTCSTHLSSLAVACSVYPSKLTQISIPFSIEMHYENRL